MRHQKLFHALCFTAVLSTSAYGGELVDIYQMALENDPRLKAAQATFNADKEIETQNKAALLPDVSLSANTTRIDSETRDYTNTGYTVSLSQPIFDASSWFTFKQGKVLSEQAAVQFEAEQQDLIFRTVEAYLEALRASSALATAKAQERAIERRLEQVNAEVEVGQIAYSPAVPEAQASYDNARVARIVAEGDLDNSYEALERLTAERFATVSTLREDYPTKAPTPSDAAPWVAKAHANNLSLRIANLSTESSRRAAQAARAGHYPTLSIAASHDYDDGNSLNDSSSETNSVGLTLSLPIYAGGTTSSRSRELTQRLVASQQNQEDTLREVTQSTRSLLRDLRTGALSVAALKQSILSSQSALEATEEGYSEGIRNVVDVLQAEQQLYAAQQNYTNARFDFVQNLIAFKQQLGTLNPDDIQQIDQWLE